MSESQATPTRAEELRALCAEATALVGNLPGRVQRVSVRTAEHAVEVEWPPLDPASPARRTPIVATSMPVGEEPGYLGATAAGYGGTTADRSAGSEPGHIVRAPLVGTFYRSPQPSAASFVSIGDVVEAGQTVALVEAMKLMNAITADVPGRVVEFYVDDEESVEFDQPLLRIAPGMHIAPADGQQVAYRICLEGDGVFEGAHRQPRRDRFADCSSLPGAWFRSRCGVLHR